MTTAAELIRQHLNDDIYTLSARSRWHEPYDKRWLLQQIQSRQKAKSKLPSWYGNFDLLFPPPLSVEQCSSELTANYKAALAHGGSLIDMTGGMGVDAAAFDVYLRYHFATCELPELTGWSHHTLDVFRKMGK